MGSQTALDGNIARAPRPVFSKTGGMLAWLKAKPRLLTWVYLFAFVGLVAPTVINYRSYPLTWDESYYLNRTICGNQAVYALSLPRLADCLAHTHKGAIIYLVNLPWGKIGGSERGIGLAFVGLALLIWGLILLTYRTCLYAGIRPEILLLVAGTICLTPFLWSTSGAMMTDTLLGWSVALALMLIPLEYKRPSTKPWPSIQRGLLWSVVINVGLNAKVTFAFFFVIIGIALILIREKYSGEYPLRYAFFACIAGCLPTIVLWRYYGLNYLRFAVMVAWGKLSGLWNIPGMTPLGFLKRYALQVGLGLIPLSILMFLFVRGQFADKHWRLARLFPLGIIFAYLGIAAKSHNRDPRFSIPVMIALPFCLAWIHSREEAREETQTKLGAASVIMAVATAAALSFPMIRRPEIAPIRQAGDLLEALSRMQPATAQPIKVVIATDGPQFNIDTFLLARQVRIDSLQRINLDTLVYDAVDKRTMADGFDRIDGADFVLFLKSGQTPGADWQRVWATDYRMRCLKIGKLLDSSTSPDMDVFRVNRSEAR